MWIVIHLQREPQLDVWLSGWLTCQPPDCLILRHEIIQSLRTTRFYLNSTKDGLEMDIFRRRVLSCMIYYQFRISNYCHDRNTMSLFHNQSL
jgi:hypothetical protein